MPPNLPADDFAELLDARVWVQEKDCDLASEENRQAIYISTMRRLNKRVMVAAIPNGAKRTRWEAGKVKREGLLTGYPDTIASWRGGVAWIEWKNGRKDPEQDQVDVLNALARQGHHVAVCRTWEGAIRFLARCGAPIAPLRDNSHLG